MKPRLLFRFTAFLFANVVLHAQQCEVPPSVLSKTEPTIFSEAQETDLGDAIEDEGQGKFRVVRGPQNDYLQKIGAALVAQLPPTKLGFKFRLIESGDVNAFTFPGGRIYVTRKLITQAKTEDEVGAVLAHELGHAYLRHTSAAMSRLFHTILGVDSVGDRKDIAEKLHRVNETYFLKADKMKRSSIDDEQDEADLLSAYLAGRAGYRPEAHAEFWDRVHETKGRTGTALSNFFGVTKPDEKRLRRIRKIMDELPAGCRNVAHRDTDGFAAWQNMVLADDRYKGELETATSTRSIELSDPIRPDLDYLRFSPDGRYLLAQDEFGIHVLRHKPLKWLFRIEAPDAGTAQFTPDSRGIVFGDPTLRVERWDIDSKSRKDVFEVHSHESCAVTRLSQDGKLLACISYDLAMRLIDTATGTVRFEDKKHSAEYWDAFFIRLLGLPVLTSIRFSEDGNYIAYRIIRDVQVVNINLGQKIRLTGEMQRALHSSFDIQGSDRFFGVNFEDPEHSPVLSFPDGRVLTDLTLANINLRAATRGDLIIVSPIKGYAAGLLDTKANKLVLGNALPALDAYTNEIVSERGTGQLGIYQLAAGKVELIDEAGLPSSEIYSARSFVISPDLRYTAFSTRNRGGIWDLTTGKRTVLLRGFQNGYFTSSEFVATFPKKEHELPIDRDEKLKKDPEKKTIEKNFYAKVPLDSMHPMDWSAAPEPGSIQVGSFLLFWREPEKSQASTLEVRKVEGKDIAWSRVFPKGSPWTYGQPEEDVLALLWYLGSDAAKAQLRGDASLASRAKGLKDKDGDFLVEIVQLSTGKSLGKLFIETGRGSFSVGDLSSTKDRIAVADPKNHTLVYSLTSGKVEGRIFGDRPVLSSIGGKLAVRTEVYTIAVFDAVNNEKLFETRFPAKPVAHRFSQDGKQLVVLTADQKVYVVACDEHAVVVQTATR
jgi:WD40 repeat protein